MAKKLGAIFETFQEISAKPLKVRLSNLFPFIRKDPQLNRLIIEINEQSNIQRENGAILLVEAGSCNMDRGGK